jgi:site-specific DNA-methyltransferase (adenine-specific)
MCITSPPYWALRDYGCDGQIGLEASPYGYVDKLLCVFNEVKRVLKKEGTLWINIDDSYANHKNFKDTSVDHIGKQKYMYDALPNVKIDVDINSKSMCCVPEIFITRMVYESKWLLRNKIIWYKPNAMPESMQDRFTNDWEYLYFFTKSDDYYFEQQKEPLKDSTYERCSNISNSEKTAMYAGFSKVKQNKYHDKVTSGELDYRNKRSVWPINTKSFSDAHYATYPEELLETPIKAGSPLEGIVLDPFMGSGTTGAVALRLNRNFIGFELNKENIKIANKRIFSSSATLDMFTDKIKVTV